MTRDELISALEKATGPDRGLDAEIGRIYVAALGYPIDKGLWAPWREKETDDWQWQGYCELLHFTASRDAMIPGAEKLLWKIVSDRLKYVDFWEVEAMAEDGSEFTSGAKTEPLARRIAEIKALVKP